MPSPGPHQRTVDPWSGHRAFLAWTATGAAACLALLTPLTIGPPLLVAVAAAAGIQIRRSGGIRAEATGLLAGAGVLLLYVAYLNRHGPGEVCHTTATEQQCTSEWSPWPWLIAGVLLVMAGTVLFRRAMRGREDADQGVDGAGVPPLAPGKR